MSGSLPGISVTWSGPVVPSGRLPARPCFNRPSPPPSRGGAALAESFVAALLRLPLGGMVHIPGAVARLRGRPGAALRFAPVPSTCRSSAPQGRRPRVAPAGRLDRPAARQPRAPPGSAGSSVPAPPVLSGPRAPSSRVFQRPGQTRHAGQDLKSGISPLPPAGGVWSSRPCIAPPCSLPCPLRSVAPSLRLRCAAATLTRSLTAGTRPLPRLRLPAPGGEGPPAKEAPASLPAQEPPWPASCLTSPRASCPRLVAGPGDRTAPHRSRALRRPALRPPGSASSTSRACAGQLRPLTALPSSASCISSCPLRAGRLRGHGFASYAVTPPPPDTPLPSWGR